MMKTARCPALFICAPASGQGKTTITAGIARYHKNQGKNVRVFKTGPDYLDPLILQKASGNPVTHLDLWMVGEEACKHYLFEAACDADLILIEGVMGLFDGAPSGADMAAFFNIPIALVIDARAMAQTFGAVVSGLTTYQPALTFAGVIANAVGSSRHQQLLESSMPDNVSLLGSVHRHLTLSLPERHLGLVHPEEVDDMDERLNALANVIEQSGLTQLPESVMFSDGVVEEVPLTLKGKKIGIAKDSAFTFIYAANEKLLKQMGAELVYFSPIEDEVLPDVDALWLPGGYPELHMEKLQNNILMKKAIKDFYMKGKKILAECGGMLYLQETLTDVTGNQCNMVGAIPGHGVMRDRGGCQGMQLAPLPEGDIRAHAHHHSRSEHTLEPLTYGKRLRHHAPGEAIIQSKGLTTTYLHLWFASNPLAIAALFSNA
jgi:cobyrinic acid a,c-diamide synthase